MKTCVRRVKGNLRYEGNDSIICLVQDWQRLTYHGEGFEHKKTVCPTGGHENFRVHVGVVIRGPLTDRL